MIRCEECNVMVCKSEIQFSLADGSYTNWLQFRQFVDELKAWIDESGCKAMVCQRSITASLYTSDPDSLFMALMRWRGTEFYLDVIDSDTYDPATKCCGEYMKRF